MRPNCRSPRSPTYLALPSSEPQGSTLFSEFNTVLAFGRMEQAGRQGSEAARRLVDVKPQFHLLNQLALSTPLADRAPIAFERMKLLTWVDGTLAAVRLGATDRFSQQSFLRSRLRASCALLHGAQSFGMRWSRPYFRIR